MTLTSDAPARTRAERPLKQVHLAAHFPGVNNTTVWRDNSTAASQIAFSSFKHFAQNAEKGKFDFLFLAEGLRLREHKGLIHDLDVVGRPNTLAVLAGIAAVTSHIGLVGTLSSTFNEPYELARQLSSLDHLSGGRAGWNIVTTFDAFHGENFRRGKFLDGADRYARAEEFVAVARQLWDAWSPDAIAADKAGGDFLAEDAIGLVDHHGPQFDVTGFPTLPQSPQGRPVIVQAGDSADGRGFASRTAEVIFSRHAKFEDGQKFYTDVKGRLAAVGRHRDSLKILPAATFILGDTEQEARERSRETALLQVSPQTAIAFLEQVWGTDLGGYDPDGPLPDIDPVSTDQGVTRGRVRHDSDPAAIARGWRALAEAEGLSIRDLVIRFAATHTFVGTPVHVAETINRHVQEDASDGFVIVGSSNPTGLDEFVDRVIPELQERGVYRTEYEEGATLRRTLGLPV
ncbi:NtaA/DmoA family FMN-dependent monooxygenase [Cryobacterium sp.]|jgi:FMN-dependent oxidoreductase (nitrilotriacetate monooxygenase family)|uniref:NtaA/DmoA family FMN-dependent monooxygenase n=1 Tax=Cryobacterium sp. TaxID=1926290 RepID=UPI00261614B7|nr:NtaA/DmoA family FMN-dependent monooxygenase [Cryobacterium sp.]MCU1446219.1 flavin-dependent methylene-tetrahydromethanopterin reductase [Cryobacterium sp.]MCU1542528.1 flavin-dependent methylene-tetrahydromethanopterin reductase [Microbacteriaceae bacterium]